MPAYRDGNKWRYRKWVTLRDGRRIRITGSPAVNTKGAAEAAERAHIERVWDPVAEPTKKEVPTFEGWFNGRFWREWVVGMKNKPSEVEAKRAIFELHLKPEFGHVRIDEIDASLVASFRASLVERTRKRASGEVHPVSDKRNNNVLAVLSKALRYAEEVRLIERAPRVALFRVERPEIQWWELDEYARVVSAARGRGPEWYAAVCLAGEAGLRVGEVKALRWREDVDLIGEAVTVNQQVRQGVLGTPKGRTRRTIPMTPMLANALRGLGDQIRTGYVIRNLDGSAKTDEQARSNIERIYAEAGLPAMGSHILRHSFGTHAALLGVNPWRLQSWMGHKRIDETMRYVHVAETHEREVPAQVLAAGASETHPDRRIIRMLGARGQQVGNEDQVNRNSKAIA